MTDYSDKYPLEFIELRDESAFPLCNSKIHARGELHDMLFQRGAKRPFQNNAKQKVKAYTHMLLATRLCSSDGPTTN